MSQNSPALGGVKSPGSCPAYLDILVRLRDICGWNKTCRWWRNVEDNNIALALLVNPFQDGTQSWSNNQSFLSWPRQGCSTALLCSLGLLTICIEALQLSFSENKKTVVKMQQLSWGLTVSCHFDGQEECRTCGQWEWGWGEVDQWERSMTECWPQYKLISDWQWSKLNCNISTRRAYVG